MKRFFFISILLIFTVGSGFADEKKIPSPTPPKPPTEPTRPIVPGATEKIDYPKFPSFPSLPKSNSQTNGPVQEVEKYDLNISGAFPKGNTSNNVAYTINSAQYILYSNRTIVLKLHFKNGSEYIYHLRNPRSKIEVSTGIFRETFDTIVQVGKEFLMERYLSELYYNDNTITTLNLIGDNKIIVLLNFSKGT